MKRPEVDEGKRLSWQRQDIENRLGFRGGKYTDTNSFLTCLGAVLLSAAFYGVLTFGVRSSSLAAMFLDRPSRVIPFTIVLLTVWSLTILLIKASKLSLQRRALAAVVIPESTGFVLARGTAPAVLAEVRNCAESPSDFVLLGRLERALGSLQNIGSVSDMVAMMESQARNDEDHMESSYTLVKGFVWAIPVLGFIGTVLGLSLSIGGFGKVLSANNGTDQLAEHLKGVTAGLSTAFETTLQGLVAALCVQLLMTGLRKREEAFLDDCKEYGHSHIISRLRTIDLQPEVINAGD